MFYYCELEGSMMDLCQRYRVRYVKVRHCQYIYDFLDFYIFFQGCMYGVCVHCPKGY